MGEAMREWASAPRWHPRKFGVSTTLSRREAPISRYVGVDLHRRRSQVVILEEDGVQVSSVKVENGDAAVFTDTEPTRWARNPTSAQDAFRLPRYGSCARRGYSSIGGTPVKSPHYSQGEPLRSQPEGDRHIERRRDGSSRCYETPQHPPQVSNRHIYI